MSELWMFFVKLILSAIRGLCISDSERHRVISTGESLLCVRAGARLNLQSAPPVRATLSMEPDRGR